MNTTETREPTKEDQDQLIQLVKSVLGEQASADFIGAKSTGVRGDDRFYGHVVTINDPNYFSFAGDDEYLKAVDTLAIRVNNQMGDVVGRVVLDVTPSADD